MDVEPGCRFCLANQLLVDTPLIERDRFYMLGSIDPQLPIAGMIIPRRHTTSPFEMDRAEWSEFGDILGDAKAHFAAHEPAGFTLCWNVGSVAGQTVFHTHLHIIPRFKGEANEGVGVRRILRTPDWPA
jgi:histidine triad (HIT) family protein